MSKCYLEIYFLENSFLDLQVLKLEECGLGLNKIGSRLQGNRRYESGVSVEKELCYLSIPAVTKDTVFIEQSQK